METARLAQNAPIMAVAWMSDDMGVVSLGRDGVISKWTRTVRFCFEAVQVPDLCMTGTESEPLAVGKVVGCWQGGFDLFCI